MTAHFISVRPEDHPHVRAVDALVTRYGLGRIAIALASVAIRRKRRMRGDSADLSDHLRRDIGLDPVGRERSYWDL